MHRISYEHIHEYAIAFTVLGILYINTRFFTVLGIQYMNARYIVTQMLNQHVCCISLKETMLTTLVTGCLSPSYAYMKSFILRGELVKMYVQYQ